MSHYQLIHATEITFTIFQIFQITGLPVVHLVCVRDVFAYISVKVNFRLNLHKKIFSMLHSKKTVVSYPEIIIKISF